jgi:signal transduction histidine kinase
MEEGNICWNIDYDRLYAKKRLPTWGMTLLSLAIGLFLSLHLRSTLKREAREKERQINAYRILAHELRTPIAVLRMNVDTLRGAFDSIPEGAKIACLRIFDQVSRLMRLADKSRDYLALETKPFAASKAFTILDLKALVEESIEELKSTSGMGEIELLEVDPGTLNTSARGDLYWAGVCIRNLLSNAATHGKPPIQVRIRELKAQVEIEVKDAGVIQKQSEKASKARTDGLGIGLSITENLMKEMGGKLIRQEKPTRFSLVFQISGGDA